jgi:hypothetical protein
MQNQPIGRRPTDPRIVERTVISELLRHDHEKLWFRGELEREMSDVDPLDIDDALWRLREDGAVCLSGELVCASRCVLHLKALEVISVSEIG